MVLSEYLISKVPLQENHVWFISMLQINLLKPTCYVMHQPV